jgi:hypothetical protein
VSSADALAAAGLAGQRLLEVEKILARPASLASMTDAVESLEQACLEWPALMACLTDREAWESLARQIARLEQIAGHGVVFLQAIETVGASARGYTADGEPARQPVGPATVNCRG